MKSLAIASKGGLQNINLADLWISFGTKKERSKNTNLGLGQEEKLALHGPVWERSMLEMAIISSGSSGEFSISLSRQTMSLEVLESANIVGTL